MTKELNVNKEKVNNFLKKFYFIASALIIIGAISLFYVIPKARATATSPDAPTGVTASVSYAKATVTTLAGSGPCGSAADGTGSAANICSPKSGSVDTAGNFFWADSGSAKIRKMTPAGVVTTIAGGNWGYVDGASGTAAFYYPSGSIVDATGNVYISDTNNCVLRKIRASDGWVSTLAGAYSGGDVNSCDAAGYEVDGTTSTATFDAPDGLVFDSAGNLFVSSYMGCTIRKITPAGVVTTVVGSYHNCGEVDGIGTAAQLNNPAGIAFDSVGNLFIADEGSLSCTIRKVTPAGVVTTLAGQPGNCGLGVDGVGSAAVFNVPSWIGIDSDDNIFVTDWLNHTIREVTEAGVVTTIAGVQGQSGSSDGTGDAARFSRPDGIAVDSSNNIYISDRYNNLIRKAVMNTAASVVVSFAAPSNNGGSTITGYTVTSSPAGGVDSDAGSTSLNHTITGLSNNGTAYTFTVVATNSVGSSSPSVSSNSVIPNLVPTRPQSLSVTPNPGQASLSWNVPSSDGGTAITHYLVYDKPTSSSNFTLYATVPASQTTSTVTSLTGGTSYDFEVVAQNSVGVSSPSVVVSSTPSSPLSTDASLSNLAVSQGTLNPTFSSGTTSYTDSVDNSVDSITITPTVNQTNATITVNGVVVASGSASSPISLNVGSNIITIIVTAQDGSTTDTYTITPTRGSHTSGGGGGGYVILKRTIAGCDNRDTGFSITTGQSCAGNIVTNNPSTNIGQAIAVPSSGFKFTQFLKLGSSGDEVIELQKFLNANLKLSLKVDGILGPKSIVALIKFQLANKLKGDGMVGALTREVLNK